MPTLSDWTNALMLKREVIVNSTDKLIKEIKERQNKRNEDLKKLGKSIEAKTITKVSDFDPEKTIYVAPITLLHALGVTTTPPVPNLADLSSTWAMIRYIWAFAIPEPATVTIPLKLSKVATGIDFHQKAVLSDDMGVAMSAIIMVSVLGTVYIIDKHLVSAILHTWHELHEL